jgi:hypothetical protein
MIIGFLYDPYKVYKISGLEPLKLVFSAFKITIPQYNEVLNLENVMPWKVGQ